MDIYIKAKAYQWTGVPNDQFEHYDPFSPSDCCCYCQKPYTEHGIYTHSLFDHILCEGEWIVIVPGHAKVLTDAEFKDICLPISKES